MSEARNHDHPIATADQIRGECYHTILLPGMSTHVKIRDVSTLSLIARDAVLVPLMTSDAATETPLPEFPPGVVGTIAPAVLDERARAVRQAAQIILDLVCLAFVEPVCSITPKDKTEFRPEDLPAAAQKFMVDYVQGRVDANGNRIDTFRQDAGVLASGEDGGTVSPVAVRSREDDHLRLAI